MQHFLQGFQKEICITNNDSIMTSERTLYHLIDSRIVSATNLDLPRKVWFSARKKVFLAYNSFKAISEKNFPF